MKNANTFASPLAERIVRAAGVLAKFQERTPNAVLVRCGANSVDYERLCGGGDITTGKAERILSALRAKWPEGQPFPD